MASIKNLKKEIHYLTQELINECFTYKFMHPEKSEDAINQVISAILSKQDELITSIQKSRKLSKNELKSEFSKISTSIDKDFVTLLDKIAIA